jgi:DNA-binding transcriptional regulator YiaG
VAEQVTTVAQKIRADRKARGLSHDRFADLLGTSRFTVIRWEKGQRLPRRLYRERLAALSGRRPDEYVEVDEDVRKLAAAEQATDAIADRKLVA